MLTLHHAPKTRSFRILWLLEEAGVPYEIQRHDIRAEGGADEAYRAVHPHKKVPAIVHDGVAVTESSAICAYVADAFPEAKLGPTIGDPLRGPFLSWLAYNAGVIEPAAFSKLFKWEVSPLSAAWGKWDDVEATLRTALSKGPYILGERFSAADVLIASSVKVAGFQAKLLPQEPPYTNYLARCEARPAHARATAKDEA
ncbi:MAG TPA: glutathione S-transferase [Caulobacteraceae bacterium]|jgi:glutathione S-transferase|nr:glutathione S-transferase [Caulobacteraceae bacterium]